MHKRRNSKIYRKYSDFYTTQDIFEPKSPDLNLTIEYYNAKGEITNPKAPCVAVTIDPDYIKDAGTRLRVRKFLVKSDILKLRDITRTKFFFYSNRLRALEKAKEEEYQTAIYNEFKRFYKVSFERLSVLEKSAFADLRRTYDELESLKDTKLEKELKCLELEHQKVFMDVKEVYQRFRYLLKLVDYFDNISKDGEKIIKLNQILNAEYCQFLKKLPASHTSEDIEKFKDLINEHVRPYLREQTYLDVVIWQKGYQNIRRKMFNYNRYLTRVALLNHVVTVIHEKYVKSYNARVKAKLYLKNPTFQQNRALELRQNTIAMLDSWQEKQANDPLVIEIEGVVPTLLSKLHLDSQEDGEEKIDNKDETIMDKVGGVQNMLLALLNELDSIEPSIRVHTELTVRRKLAKERQDAKQALVKQTRLKNLVDHYKIHHAKKNIVKGYITLIPRPRGKVYPLKNVS